MSLLADRPGICEHLIHNTLQESVVAETGTKKLSLRMSKKA